MKNKLTEKLKKIKLEPSMLVLFLFLMLIFSRLVVYFTKDTANEYLTVVILQILTFGIPAAIWYRLRELRRFRDSDRRYGTRLRLSPPKPSHIVIIVAACLALISGCLLFSIGFSGRSSLEGSFSLYDTFVSKYNGTPLGALWLIMAYAALPAICEETVFRGIICTEYDKYGVVCAVSFNTLFFALMHFNYQKLPIYLFAGVVLSVLLYATRSVFSVMIAHFLYNLFGIFGQRYITEFYITAGSVKVAVIILITLLLLSAAVFCGAARRLYSGYAKRDELSEYYVGPLTKKQLGNNVRACLTPLTYVCFAVFLIVATIFVFI